MQSYIIALSVWDRYSNLTLMRLQATGLLLECQFDLLHFKMKCFSLINDTAGLSLVILKVQILSIKILSTRVNLYGHRQRRKNNEKLLYIQTFYYYAPRRHAVCQSILKLI